jgi:hypothetical protein
MIVEHLLTTKYVSYFYEGQEYLLADSAFPVSAITMCPSK